MNIVESFYVIRLDQGDGVGVYLRAVYGKGPIWWYVCCSLDPTHCKKWKTFMGAMKTIDRLEYSRSEAAKDDTNYQEMRAYISRNSGDYSVDFNRVTFKLEKITITTKTEEIC